MPVATGRGEFTRRRKPASAIANWLTNSRNPSSAGQHRPRRLVPPPNDDADERRVFPRNNSPLETRGARAVNSASAHSFVGSFVRSHENRRGRFRCVECKPIARSAPVSSSRFATSSQPASQPASELQLCHNSLDPPCRSRITRLRHLAISRSLVTLRAEQTHFAQQPQQSHNITSVKR